MTATETHAASATQKSSPETIKVLLIRTDPHDGEDIRQMLSEERNFSFKVDYVKEFGEALIQLGKEKTDIVLLDLSDSEGWFLDFFLQIHDKVPALPIIVIVDIPKETCAVEFIRNGAQECLIKEQLHGKMLARVIHYAIERKQVEERLKTHAQHLAEELERTLKELREKEEEMVRREKVLATGEMAASLAHEIRNPLSVISMSVQYLQSKFKSKDPNREFTEAIIRKVERLDSMTKHLITYGRRNHLKLVRRNINRSLDRTLSLMKIHCRSQRIAIIRRYTRWLPLVTVDEEMIDQVFTNIITNAVQAMPGGGRLILETGYDAKKGEVLIKISDTGAGISLKYRKSLFKPFFSTKKEECGSGLGLTISHRIVTDHGGTISVQTRRSRTNHGTTFTIRLPINGQGDKFEQDPTQTTEDAEIHFGTKFNHIL